jgi:hypothetical protein
MLASTVRQRTELDQARAYFTLLAASAVRQRLYRERRASGLTASGEDSVEASAMP